MFFSKTYGSQFKIMDSQWITILGLKLKPRFLIYKPKFIDKLCIWLAIVVVSYLSAFSQWNLVILLKHIG